MTLDVYVGWVDDGAIYTCPTHGLQWRSSKDALAHARPSQEGIVKTKVRRAWVQINWGHHILWELPCSGLEPWP